jgi:hypothetical protein
MAGALDKNSSLHPSSQMKTPANGGQQARLYAMLKLNTQLRDLLFKRSQFLPKALALRAMSACVPDRDCL